MAISTSRINSIFAAFGIDPAEHASRNGETVQEMLSRMESQHSQDSLVSSLLRAYPNQADQFVRALFESRGVPIAQTGETEPERIARIVEELKAGRTFTDLQTSLDRLSGETSPPATTTPTPEPATEEPAPIIDLGTPQQPTAPTTAPTNLPVTIYPTRINSLFSAFGINPATHAASNGETVDAMMTRISREHTQDSLVQSLLRKYPQNGYQFVQGLFTSRGLTVAQGNETEAQRINRLISELQGGRTFTDIQASLDSQAGIVSPPSAPGSGTAPPGEEATGGTAPKLNLNQVPDGAEVWRNSQTNQSYIVFRVPGTDIPMAWSIDDADLQAAFGEGVPITSTSYTTSQINSYGTIMAGTFAEIANTTENPFDAWSAAVEKQAAVRPWLRDPEVLALVAEAMVEGRPLSDAELQQTEWWRTKTEAERQWMVMYESDPLTAQALQNDNRTQVKTYFEQMGVEGVPTEVVNYMADQFTTGLWTDIDWRRQAEAIGDPASNYAVDPELAGLLANTANTMTTTQQFEDKVRELAAEWLGPVFGNMDSASLSRWARKLRASSDGQDELVNYLRQQRLGLYPEYENPNLTYEDLAGPWRNVLTNMWGQTPDETDSIFDQMIRTNDRVANEKLLRSEGLQRDISQVVQDMQSSALNAFGGSVRRPVSG